MTRRRTAAEWRAFYHWDWRAHRVDLELTLLLFLIGLIGLTVYGALDWILF